MWSRTGAAIGRVTKQENPARACIEALSLPGRNLGITSQVGMRMSLPGTQARLAGKSSIQEEHVAEVDYGETVIVESEGPVTHEPPNGRRIW